MKTKQYYQQLVQCALAVGLSHVIVQINTKNHLYLSVLCPNGEIHKVFAAKTPSDFRTMNNHTRNCKIVYNRNL